MNIKFKSLARHNPMDPTAPKKYYPYLVSGHTINLEQLAEILSDGSTLSEADIVAVLMRLQTVIGRELAWGNRVKLGTLGTFFVGLSGEPAEKPDLVTSDQIKRVNVNFKPSKRLTNKLLQVTFIKVHQGADGTGGRSNQQLDDELFFEDEEGGADDE